MEKLILKNEELPYALAEEMKTLRTNILFCGEDKKVIMITSCLSGEGKSTVSLNMARSFVELKKKVLFIDTDLRKSVIANKISEGKVEGGLSHYLSGQKKLQDVIYETETKNLYLIPAGTVPPNPSELLSGQAFDKMIHACKEIFDFIIIDCAPLGMVIDAAVVAPRCDGSLLLIEAGNVKYHHAQEVKKNLEKTGTPILGCVLNKVDRRRDNRYYGKEYAKRYEAYYK